MTDRTQEKMQPGDPHAGTEAGAAKGDTQVKTEAANRAGQSSAELYDQLLRLKADFENYRKRVDREKPEWIRLGEAGLLSKLLPLYDTLFQAHEQVLKTASTAGGNAKELIAGLELLFKEFTKIFDSEGVKVIETIGKPYHHDLHEALGTVETDGQPDGTVIEELQRGYMWQGKVLRPARVRIAKQKI